MARRVFSGILRVLSIGSAGGPALTAASALGADFGFHRQNITFLPARANALHDKVRFRPDGCASNAG
jgi:hypothetical protein